MTCLCRSFNTFQNRFINRDEIIIFGRKKEKVEEDLIRHTKRENWSKLFKRESFILYLIVIRFFDGGILLRIPFDEVRIDAAQSRLSSVKLPDDFYVQTKHKTKNSILNLEKSIVMQSRRARHLRERETIRRL